MANGEMRMIAPLERAPGRAIAALTALFVCAYAASLVWLAKPDGRIVLGDALHHYVQLRSAVFDGDLKFTNDYLHLYGPGAGQDSETEWIVKTNATGHIRNLMPVGPAILWAPLFLLVTAGVWVADALGAAYPLDGYARLFQASAGFSGILAAGLGAWFAYLAAASLVSRRAAIWATLAVWLASSALYYSAISPTYSHAASMLAVSAFFLAFVRTVDRQDLGRYALLGALAGIAALMRWQDAILIVIPIGVALTARRGAAGVVARLAVTVAAAAVAFSPQSFVWQRLYGHPLTIPQGASFMKWSSPALWAVLVSDSHGLFSWTPVLLLSLAGLVPLVRRDARVGIAATVFLTASWYVNASVADWWGGEAFGGRRFVACFPVFVLATAALFERWRDQPRRIVAISLVFIALNGLLLVQYQSFMHGLRTLAPYPTGWYGLYAARFVVPLRLAGRWLLR
jgi:hypothetical protein